MRSHLLVPAFSLLLFISLALPFSAQGGILTDHLSVETLAAVPDSVIQGGQRDLRIFYGHTSHGGQILEGMYRVWEENNLYAFNQWNAGEGSLSIEEYPGDLGSNGDTTWAGITRTRLDQPDSDINMVMWSWCGGATDNTVEGIQIYLQTMNQLELDYPDVIFVYMTGHLDGTGPEGTLYLHNNMIRDYCAQNGKILYDFADIESYDPDGVYYPDASDACEWCIDWCAANECMSCGSCAHSHCFNCWRKAEAFWTMVAEIEIDFFLGPTAAPSIPSANGLFLLQNVPNPFNPRTQISFSLKRAGDVRLDIYNSAGERVTTLLDGPLDRGPHSVSWNGTDSAGRKVASGGYHYTLSAGGHSVSRKMVLLK